MKAEPPSEPIADNPSTDRCYRCDYDLRGIADQQPCPECGLIALQSRQPNDEIRFTHPAWLATQSRGVTLLFFAAIFALLSPAAMSFLVESNEAQRLIMSSTWSSWLSVELVHLVPMIGPDVMVFLLIIGTMLITRPEPSRLDDARERRLRWALRLIVFIPLIALIFGNAALRYLMTYGRSGWSPTRYATLSRLTWTALIIATIGTAPLPVLLSLRLRYLAIRARSAQLAEHCGIVGVGTSLTLLYIAIALYVTNHATELGFRENWINNSEASLWIVLMSVVAPLLFVLWSLYLLLRFAIRFHRAARQRRREWLRDDARLRLAESGSRV